ncbi:MAG: hypothetical protein CMN30_10320 [Sandaracinus sp.]|nr:hypothetical protein [Sandaracinus sp.]|tara:strand:- start:1279 stop:1500 length:222 start_codon:yes stop_codon:yes gene_type:complete
MTEKQRAQRIEHELAKVKAELARQDREVEDLAADLDPAELAEAERTFTRALRRLERREENPNPASVPTFAVRV